MTSLFKLTFFNTRTIRSRSRCITALQIRRSGTFWDLGTGVSKVSTVLESNWNKIPQKFFTHYFNQKTQLLAWDFRVMLTISIVSILKQLEYNHHNSVIEVPNHKQKET